MSVRWTKEQEDAMNVRGCDLLVSAAAGSGKTAVLVERIIRRVLDAEQPTDIDRLLVVTFTKAAAAEMRERVAKAIEARMEKELDSAWLHRQYTLVHHAQITTIDSFCLYVVKNYFQCIGLAPGFRVGDPAELSLIMEDVLGDVLEQWYTKEDEAFLAFADDYASAKSDAPIADMVRRLYDFAQSYPWSEAWLAGISQPYEPPQLTAEALGRDDSWLSALKAYIHSVIGGERDRLKLARKLCLEPDGPDMYLENIERLIEQVERLLELRDYDALGIALAGIDFGRLAARRGFSGDKEAQELVKSLRTKVKAELGKLHKKYFALPLAAQLSDLEALGERVRVLSELTLDYAHAYRTKKEELGLLDFSDIEHMALRILVDETTKEPTQVAREFQALFEEVMIDEYQDSNYVQEAILSAVAGGGGRRNRFMVGDVKQSIYRFRLARPELFMEKYDTYTGDDALEEGSTCAQDGAPGVAGACAQGSAPAADAPGENGLSGAHDASRRGGAPGRKICLRQNFRSRPQVLGSVNSLFYRIMKRDVGGVDYDDEAALRVGAQFPTAEEQSFQTRILLAEADPEAQSESGADSARALEAALIAEEICRVMETQRVSDGAGGFRPVHYSDIVILLRSPGSWGDELTERLAERGIPSHRMSQTGYFSATEVQAVLALCQVIDNPLQDIPLAALLRSLFFGFSSEELARIRVSGERYFFFERLSDYAKNGADDALKEKAARFLESLSDFRERARHLSVHDLLDQILRETGYLNLVRALPAGERRLANVEMLLQQAVSFERTSYRGLFSFIRYMQKLQKYEVDFGEADVAGESEDVVRIMSIHKSKGLEFPVVFVSGLGRRFNKRDSTDAMILDSTFGVGLSLVERKKHRKRTTLLKEMIAAHIAGDNIGEELRVLYVALTRAKEQLILTGTLKGVEAALSRYEQEAGADATFLDRREAGCYLDWILPGAYAQLPGAAVRSCADVGVSNDPCGEPGEIARARWSIETCAADDFRLSDTLQRAECYVEKEQLLESLSTVDGALVEAIDERLRAAYPHEAEVSMRTKISVSEIKHRNMILEPGDEEALAWYAKEEQEDSYVPLFAREEQEGRAGQIEPAAPKEVDAAAEGSISRQDVPEPLLAGNCGSAQPAPAVRAGSGIHPGALRGTAMHRFMECIDYGALAENRTYEEVVRQLESLSAQGRIDGASAALIDEKRVWRFLQSGLADRIMQAHNNGTLYREQPFVMGLPAREADPDMDSDELVLVQGIIDLFFEEDGALVLLDYKTDAVKDAGQLIDRYRTQMELYARALAAATGKAVKERLIYSFKLGEIVEA